MRWAAPLAALACLAGCHRPPAATDAVEAPLPQPGVNVEAVAAWLALDPDALRLEARVRLTVAHPDTLGTLALGLGDAMQVRAARVDGRPAATWHAADRLRIALPGGRVRSVVEVVYDGVPSAGLYADTWQGRRVVYTDGWPHRTAGWLAAVHHPSDPVRLDLTVAVPESLAVAASGAPVSVRVAGGRRHARFRLDGRTAGGRDGAPAYTAAFAVGPFHVVEGGRSRDGVTLRHVLLDRALAPQMSRTAAALDTLAALFGPYPYATYTTVQVPLAYAGMENAAAPFLRASLYTSAPSVEAVNLHELVHQWWGNAVVPADWRDLWLAEGPATYLTADLVARLDGPEAGRQALLRLGRDAAPADADRRLVPHAPDRPADVLSPTVYQKGASVLHLLRLTVGEQTFWETMRRLQTTHAQRPLSTAQFQAAFEQAAGRSLGALFARWVHGEGRPVLATRWDPSTRTLRWRVRGDGGTLDGVPFNLYVQQRGQPPRWLPATRGAASLRGTARPTVEPVGLLLDVR